MNILNFRVDDRLVHGVVATNWVPRNKIERVICIDDESAKSPMLKSALRMATPNTVYLSVLETATAIANLKEDRYENQKVMVVVKSPKVILDLVNAGLSVPKLILGNLGNIKRSADTVAITRYVSINNENKEYLEQLHEKGVELEAQLIPEDSPIEFYKEMKSKI